MKKIAIILTIIFFALISSRSFAGAPDVREAVSESGLKAWFIEDNFLPIVAIKLAFNKSGFAYDPDDKQGISFMVSSLLDEGAGDYSGIEFQRKLEASAINLSFNADEDYFYVSVKTLKNNLDETIDLLLLALMDANFEEEAVERIRSQILVLIEKKKENPSYIASEKLAKELYKDHPYSRNEYGVKDQIKKFTKQDLKDFTHNNFAKDNIYVSVVGAVNEQDVIAILDNIATKLSEKQVQKKAIATPKYPQKGRDVKIEKNIPQTNILFTLPSVLRLDPNFYPLYLANHIFGGGSFESRLMQIIREENGLAYSAYSHLSGAEKSGVISGYIATEGEKANESLKLLKQEIKKINKSGVTKQELVDAKSYLINSFPLKMTKNTKLAGFLISMQKDNLGIDFLKVRNKIVEDVHIEEVNRAAYEYFRDDKRITVIVGE